MSRSSLSPTGLIGAAIAAVCAMSAAQAEEFSWQLSGALREAESANFETDSWALDATFYMKPITDSTGPLALASFLNPTTRVSLATSGVDAPQDPTAYTLGGAYVLPGEKWYVGGDYAKSHVDDASSFTLSDPFGYGVHAGRYLGANTTLELRLGRSEQKSLLPCGGPVPQLCLAAPIELKSTTDTVGLEVFHVRRFRSLTYSLQGGVVERDFNAVISQPLPGGVAFDGDGPSLRQYSVAAELFPTNRLGVRLGYSRPEDFDVDAYDVTATWYFKPRIAMQLGLSQASNDEAPPGLGRSESLGLRFIGRL